jgi:GNAT superfamily N-acetyltransferase
MALAHAAQRDAIECARLLLDRGPEDWGERENALVWAARSGASEAMVRLLAERGANLEASLDGSGRTPYGEAVRSGRRDVAEVLVALGARRRVQPVDELVGACVSGDRAAAMRLAAAHPEAAVLLGTAEAGLLASMAARGQRESVALLLDLGVPVDARGLGGETALEAAADGGVAELLLARGADAAKRAPSEETRGAVGEPPFAELAHAAEAAHLRALASSPLAEARPCGDGFAVVTGIDDNTENGVVCDSASAEAVAATLAWFAERGAPARWLVGADADVHGRLVAAGASPERTAVVMGAELDRRAPDAPSPPGLTILPVRDRPTLDAWRAVAAACLFDDADRRADLLASLGLDAQAPVQHRVALRDGRPVGAASFLLHDETVLGQHVGVLAAERRGGIGRALLQHIASEARAAGARYAVLGPTPDTVAFHRLLGAVLRPALRDRTFYVPL